MHFNQFVLQAHEQLRTVLLTLLEELPSDLPILLLGTSSHPPDENEDQPFLVFPQRSVYQVSLPSTEDKSLCFERLIEAALSVFLEGMSNKSQESTLPELPKVPKVASGPKASELKPRIEAEQHALRRMRMCLRDVCNSLVQEPFNAEPLCLDLVTSYVTPVDFFYKRIHRYLATVGGLIEHSGELFLGDILKHYTIDGLLQP
ncbi:ATPase family AAA domain-containing protein At1g05910-like [Euphorbia lathyris]|uniref:ATPase family AAA domain-containing protein At1g05910-like n=1 Tax=Euphorbia lathyris TaxID=212925 RepID=UPI0033143C85